MSNPDKAELIEKAEELSISEFGGITENTIKYDCLQCMSENTVNVSNV